MWPAVYEPQYRIEDWKYESKKVKKKVYFLPSNWPMRASHLPHLWSVTPRYFELPLANPVLCLRSMCTNSSFVRFLIWCLIKKWTKESININIKQKINYSCKLYLFYWQLFAKSHPTHIWNPTSQSQIEEMIQRSDLECFPRL